MTTPEPGADDDAEMRRRLASLSRDLSGSGKSENAARPGGPMPQGVGQAVSLGFRVMSEFVAAVAVGAFIGWLIDHWMHSSPFGLILFIALGTAAGFWSVYRVAAGPGAK